MKYLTLPILLIANTLLFGQQPAMLSVPAGSYTMGCTASQVPCDGDNIAHSVTLDSFYLSAYEITQSEYETLTGVNPSNNAGCSNCPVENITWYDAITYCNLLSQQAGLTPAYYAEATLMTVFNATTGAVYWNKEGNGYRLPTEAEWEYAARSGGTEDFRYAGSDTGSDVAIFNTSSTAAVGTKSPNALGFYDLSGNASEWVWDSYASYPNMSVCNPIGPNASSVRILRGGDYQSIDPTLAKRTNAVANAASMVAGFRVCSDGYALSLPDCVTTLTTPTDGATNVAVTTDIEWLAGTNATGYRISLGTTSGGTDLVNDEDLGNVLLYNPTTCLPVNTTIYVMLTAYNVDGDATGCTGFPFTTADTSTPEMISIPGGTFEMGCTAEQSGCFSNESPVHTVELDGFFMSEYELTQSEWEALVPEYTPSYSWGQGGTNPVYRVSWYDVATYCNRLSIQEGLEPCYYFDEGYLEVFDTLLGSTSSPYPTIDLYWKTGTKGYRLPTEAEWEYAARGGGASPQTLYSGSDTADEVAWYTSNSSSMTHPVGGKCPNELGLYDMSGNVWEWCWDWYSSTYYSSSPAVNPTGPVGGSSRVPRGGSWGPGSATSLRVALRVINGAPGCRSGSNGFRLSRTPSTTTIGCVPTLTNPTDGATNIAVTTDIEWLAAANATGYRVSLGTTSGGTDLVNDEDLGNVLLYQPTTCLPGNTTIYVTLTAYNVDGDATGCTGFSFTTADVTTPEMISIPGGTFEMGCTAEQSGCGSDESPVHTVTLAAFEMSTYEVTQCQWEALVPEYTPNYTVGQGGTNPVYRVSWYDVATYCNRLSIQEGLEPCYYFDEGYLEVFDTLLGSTSSPYPTIDLYWKTGTKGYRLPTEAEWEYAARGGEASPQTLYSGSDTVDEVGWYSGNSSSMTHPVGGKLPNELGLYDMSGNVREWCWDWYDSAYYSSSPAVNPTGPVGGSFRVLRGGSWGNSATFLRVASRLIDYPGIRVINGFGFRLSRTP